MDIKNSKDIFKDLLNRYNFSSIYFENGYTWGQGLANFFAEPAAAADFLLSSAFTGNKVIGFFKNAPLFKTERFIRGECVFVAERIPAKIKSPTLFCRRPENFTSKLSAALKASRESKLPVFIIISPNAVNGFADFVKPEADLARTSPYLHPASLEIRPDEQSVSENMKIARQTLAAALPFQPFEKNELSFFDPGMEFFDYLIPGEPTEAVKALAGKKVSAPEDEAPFLRNFLKANYVLDLEISPLPVEPLPEVKEFLCPGCPFANIFIKWETENKMVFTDVSCDGIFKAFKLNFSSLDTYAGLLSNGLKAETMFIGAASSYKPYYDGFFKNGLVIFLNDCGLAGINVCSSVSHPKKFPKDMKNVLYPYGCFNIKKYSKPKIKVKKCVCIGQKGACECMEKTKCPALFVKDGSAAIDYDLCTGCYACKAACKPGAVS